VESYRFAFFVTGSFHSIMSSKLIHVATYVRISFLGKDEHSTKCVYHILPIHIPMDRWAVGCFHVLVIVNNIVYLFDSSYPNECEVVLICISLMISNIDHLFTCLLFFIFFGEMSAQVLCPFFNWVV
jgi:hypothetical protein